MPTVVFTYGVSLIGAGNEPGSINWEDDTIKAILVRDTYVPNRDHRFLSSIAGHEIVADGYAGGFGGLGRKALVGKTRTVNDADDRVDYDAVDPSFGNLGGAGGGAVNDTISYVVLAKEMTSDADSPMIACLDLVNHTTTGGTVSVRFPDDYAFYASTAP